MHRQLIDRKGRGRMALEMCDVAILRPHLAGSSVEVGERWGENRLQHLPRAIPKRLDELDIQIGQRLDRVHGCSIRWFGVCDHRRNPRRGPGDRGEGYRGSAAAWE